MMTRPTRIAQTTHEAKREFKKNGHRLPEDQQRQLARHVELSERAARFRAQEERRRAAKKKREEKERKERQARRQLGVGLATQLVGFSHTQAKLKSGMEAFVGLKKREEREETRQAEVRKKLDAIAEAVEQEPWDDGNDDDFGFEDDSIQHVHEADSLIDDDLDDDTLLDVHYQVMSGAVGVTMGRSFGPPPSPRPVAPSLQEPAANTGGVDFQRLHGPINKAIENVLERLPEPLVELLSVDCSANQQEWAPPPSLLHKLNPVGLPPHRLRVKVGCVVSLLRNIDTTNRLSKSDHLKVLRVKPDHLECLVLKGEAQWTRVSLTQVLFHANYRNEKQFPFQRLQFPIRVSTDFTPLKQSHDNSHPESRVSSVRGQPLRLPTISKKPVVPNPRTMQIVNRDPTFQLPGLPASKSTKPPAPRLAHEPYMPINLDGWDDFLDSGTQIARELSSDNKLVSSTSAPSKPTTRVERETNPPFGRELPAPSIPTRKPAGPSKPSANLVMGGPSRPIQQPNLKRKAPFETPMPPPKEPTIELTRSMPSPGLETSAKPFSFSDFGLSTQEAHSFFDDDGFSSPTLTV